MHIFYKIKKKMSDTEKSMLMNMLVKPISMLISFIYVPLLLGYLGDEKYGLWSTVLSVISWINYCDIGIGNGLRNILAKELTLKEWKKAKKSVSTAYVILSAISMLLLIVLVILVFSANWYAFFNTNIDMRATLLISFICICINFILSLGNIILYALQLSEQIAFINLSANIINLLGVIILSWFSHGNLVYVSILFGLSTSITYLYNNIRIFSKYKQIKPSIKYYDRDKTRALCSLGIMFFILQLAGLVMNTTDNILVTRLFNAREVTPFNVVYKFFSAIESIFTALLIPIWSGTTKAIAQGDIKWIKNIINKLNKIIILFSFIFIIGIFLFKPIARIWLGKDLNYVSGLIIVTALSCCASSISNTYSNILNGMNKIKFQMYIGIFQGIINIPLSILLAVNCNFGVIGIKLSTLILFSISAVVYCLYTMYTLKTEILE